jgi:predicted SprT family Zn-dependent metalloprotease
MAEKPLDGIPSAAQGRPLKALAVQKLARELLDRHGLHDWVFAFNRRKRSLGFCWYGKRTIELSIYLVARNGEAEILDTLLHEIAHALVGPGHGHDAVWRRKCREIGALPLRCGQADMPDGRWRARCGSCGKGFHRYRKPKRMEGWFCRGCGPERGQLAWQLLS